MWSSTTAGGGAPLFAAAPPVRFAAVATCRVALSAAVLSCFLRAAEDYALVLSMPSAPASLSLPTPCSTVPRSTGGSTIHGGTRRKGTAKPGAEHSARPRCRCLCLRLCRVLLYREERHEWPTTSVLLLRLHGRCLLRLVPDARGGGLQGLALLCQEHLPSDQVRLTRRNARLRRLSAVFQGCAGCVSGPRLAQEAVTGVSGLRWLHFRTSFGSGAVGCVSRLVAYDFRSINLWFYL